MNEFEEKLARKANEKTAGETIADTLDRAVDGASDFIGTERGSRLVGGAAVGALAAVLLPISVGAGALIGAGYVAYRQMKKSD